MSQAFNQCSLYLRPAQHDFTLDDINSFIVELQNIQFISKVINKQSNTYYTGENFLDYIAYMGCAPTIQFEPTEDNEKFCKVSIQQYKTTQLIISQHQSVSPLCPHCKKPVKNWLDNKADESIHCTQCNKTSNINAFNWRKMAGYAQLFIEISDIFPKEALPQHSLLDKLKNITSTDWLYFYSCR